MRYTTSLLRLLAILSFSHLGLAADQTRQADFTGTWQLDSKRSEGVPSGMEQTLIVKQSADRVDVEVKVSGPQGDRTSTDAYILNGKEADFTPAILGGGTPKSGKRTSTWAADGTGFEATEKAVLDGPEGDDEITGKRTWRLSPDGKELTIVMDLQGGGGPLKSKRIFTRK